MKQPEYKNGRPPAFTMVRYMKDDRWVTAARFQCQQCPTKLDIPVSGTPEPTHMARLAGDKRWAVSAWTASATRCPTCKAAKAKGESPKDPPKEMSMATSPKPPAAAPTPTQAATLPREPTTDQRIRIRALLDANFDDKAGCYLAEYSDQRIGEEVGVPWAVVTKIREVGYGPIRVDPEVEQMRAQVATAEKYVAALKAGMDNATAQIADLRKKLTEIEAKRAAQA